MEAAWRGDDTSQYSSHAEATAQLVQAQMNFPESQNTTIALAYSNGAALGAFFGSMMDKSTDKPLLQTFLAKLRQAELKKKKKIWLNDASLQQ